MVVGAIIYDPELVTLGDESMVGHDALFLPHAINVIRDEDVLVLGRISVGQRAIIGAKTTVMANVEIGDDAMVTAMSLVSMNTKIPAGEIWGGIPAKKIGMQTDAPNLNASLRGK